MPKSPLTAAYQKRLRRVVSGMLPDARIGHLAEAIAVGYGFQSHNALAEAIKLLAASGPGTEPAPFDVGAFLARLASLGSPVEPTSLPLLMATLEHQAPSEVPDAVAQPRPEALGGSRETRLLAQAHALAAVGSREDAAGIYGRLLHRGSEAMKPQAIAGLRTISPRSPTAAVNLGTALLFGDGCAPDPAEAKGLLEAAARSSDPSVRQAAHNWLGHLARGAFGQTPNMAEALLHLEEAGRLGNGEAAYNAGLIVMEGARGVRKDQARASRLFELAAAHGHVAGTTNYARSILGTDPNKAIGLLEWSAARGDEKAASFLAILDRTGENLFGGSRTDSWAIKFVPPSIGRPKEVAARLCERLGIRRPQAEEITARIYGFERWRDLARAASSGPADVPDEGCCEEILRKRRAFQASVLMNGFGLSLRAAEELAETLAATAAGPETGKDWRT